MEDLFKQIRNNLENRPEPDFSNRDWKDLEKRLDRHDGKRRIGFLWWTIIFLLALLAGSGTWLLTELNSAQKKISHLESKLALNTNNQFAFETDTVYLNRIVAETVFVYREIPSVNNSAIQYNGKENLASQNQQIHNNQLLNERYKNVDGAGFDLTAIHDKNLKDSITLLSEISSGGIDGFQQAEIVAQDTTGTLNADSTLVSNLTPEQQNPNKESGLHKTLRLLSPDRTMIGITGGFPFILNEDLAPHSGFFGGVACKVELLPQLQITADVRYLNLKYESDLMNPAIGIPYIPAPGDNLTFKHSEVSANSVQYSLGFQFTFNQNRNFKPFVGVGYGIAHMLPYEVIYEFQGLAETTQWIVDRDVRYSGPLTNICMFNAGVQYQLMDNFVVSMDGEFRKHFASNGLIYPNQIGIRTGLFYMF